MPSPSRSSRHPEASDAAGSGAVPRQPKFLTALPVFNEVRHVEEVLDEVLRFTPHVLVVDDGSTDGTSRLLADRLERQGDIRVVRHPQNRGYGAALATAFRETLSGDWDGLVTIDCDGQHQPRLIPAFTDAATIIGAAGDPAAAQLPDIVSGSRYLKVFDGDSRPPESRRRINETITAEINARLGLSLTDAFCGLVFPAPFLVAFLTVNAFLGAWPKTLLSLHTCACVPFLPFFGMVPEPKNPSSFYGTKL